MALLPIDKLIKMYKDVLAGKEVVAVTPEEKESKAQVLKDIAYAKEKGYQIDFPSDL